MPRCPCMTWQLPAWKWCRDNNGLLKLIY
uniref:Uncharacterized protein n=1 Tax=Anguilla anguilla TaxID=7936 RepID=A0A0E9WH86_ANGAN